MGDRLGIIAGSGEFPAFAVDEAKKQGYSCMIAGIKGAAEEDLRTKSENIKWFELGDILDIILYFHKSGVKELLLAGKFDHRMVFHPGQMNKSLSPFLNKIRDKRPSALILFFMDFLKEHGLAVKNPMPFLLPAFCEEGVLTRSGPSLEVEKDIRYGWEIARKMADLDIGQTIVLKDRAIAAVEGIEGTDEAILRGGSLAGKGSVVIKVSRTDQDPRIDMPAVGMTTVKSMVKAGCKVLCLEAGKMPFFRKVEAVELADKNGIALIAKKG